MRVLLKKLQSMRQECLSSPAPRHKLQQHILRRQAVAAQRRGQRPDRAPPQRPPARAQARIQRATRASRISFADHCNGMQARHLQAPKLS